MSDESLSRTSLMYKINYAWRVFATGLSFAVFGIGGVCIALTLSCYFRFAPQSPLVRRNTARSAISGAFRLYISFMKLCGLLTVDSSGMSDFAGGGKLIIANHPSLLDVVFIISMVPDADCVVREGLKTNRFTRRPILAAQYITNNDPLFLAKCKESIDQGNALVLFPEGTRTRPDSDMKFQRGAARVALEASCPIVPVLITCEPPTLQKYQKWYSIPKTPPHFTFTCLPDLSVNTFQDEGAMKSTQVRRLTRYLARYYEKHVNA